MIDRIIRKTLDQFADIYVKCKVPGEKNRVNEEAYDFIDDIYGIDQSFEPRIYQVYYENMKYELQERGG